MNNWIRQENELAPLIFSVIIVVLLAGCAERGQRMDARIPPGALLPVGTAAPLDGSRRFAETFCSVLEAMKSRGGSWEDCSRYLEPAAGAQALPPLASPHSVVVVPGIFGRCIAHEVQIYKEALEHLRSLGVAAESIDVSGLGGTHYNGEQIVKHLRGRLASDPEATFLVVGYSKGAPDAMEALAMAPELTDHVAALVTVAGCIGGSRIPDALDETMAELVGDLAPDRCGVGDGQGIDSLRRTVRQEFLRDHPRPFVPTYSLVAISTFEETSAVHHATWRHLSGFETEHDGQVIAYEAVAPGATYLGAARADHWAVALPFEYAGGAWPILVDKNHYPREALLEAIVRFVTADLQARPWTTARAGTH